MKTEITRLVMDTIVKEVEGYDVKESAVSRRILSEEYTYVAIVDKHVYILRKVRSNVTTHFRWEPLIYYQSGCALFESNNYPYPAYISYPNIREAIDKMVSGGRCVYEASNYHKLIDVLKFLEGDQIN